MLRYKPVAGLARPVRGEHVERGFAQRQGIHAGKLINLVLPGFRRVIVRLPAAMGMSGFIAAGRFDNPIGGDEFGNYNSSHDLFFVKPANVV